MDLLLSPTSLGPVELRNRVFVSAHTTNFSERNLPTRRYTDYLARRARGGVGLVFTEPLRVLPSSLRRFGLAGFLDDSILGLSEVVDAVKAEGSAIFGQLLHTGRHDGSEWTATWAPSAIPWTTQAEIPHAMTQAEIRLVVDAFGSTARRLVSAGYDGAEVHIGHGHLLQQFLSPITNTRSDGYGGDETGRLRIVREVLDSVFREVGSEMPIGIRLSADEFLDGGLDQAATTEIVARLLEEFPLAFLHVSHSAYSGSWSLATQMADMSFGSAPFRELPAAFKRNFPHVPVLAICRMDNLEVAATVIQNGEADLVGLTRAHIADPDLVVKTLSGNASTIRSCIACNQGCIGRLEKTLPIRCVVNPEVGQEQLWHRRPPNVSSKRVLVVGGGPAGLEATIAAANRGHQVAIVEAGDRLGGQVRYAARLEGRNRFSLLVDELEQQVKLLAVSVELGRRIDAPDIMTSGWGEVVLATGSRPRACIPASHTTWQAIDAPDELGEHVVIFDEDGGWAAAGLAEDLAARGKAVQLVTTEAALAWRITTYSKLGLLDRLGKRGVRVRLLRAVTEFSNGAVIIADVLTGEVETLTDVSAVVHAGIPAADDGLFYDLVARGYPNPIHLVGDAYAPRTCLEAVYEGRSAGVSVGIPPGVQWGGPPMRTPHHHSKHAGDLRHPLPT